MTEALPRYSFLERLLHKGAFGGLELQKSLADIEDRMHAKHLGSIKVERPVFVTALPRAGTTLLLDLIAGNPGFATHTYRCMPFVLCPVLWDSISRGFRRPNESRERAHGDGMMVSYDSPEAFEEILWKAFWPKKYRKGQIDLWSEMDRNSEFEEFFQSHIRKLILLRAGANSAGVRYISKNNANIARIGLLSRIFPDSIFIIPFRNPVDQAGSLLRQHKRFVEIHGRDPFSRQYMEAIGHYEFGGALRPLAFPNAGEEDITTDAMTADYWVHYWIRTYSHLLTQQIENVYFLNFDRLCADANPSLAALNRVLGLGDISAGGVAESAQGQIHQAVRHDTRELNISPRLLEKSLALLETLNRRATNQ